MTFGMLVSTNGHLLVQSRGTRSDGAQAARRTGSALSSSAPKYDMPASPSSSTSAILAELQDIRVKTARQPRHVVELGTTLIERGWTSSGGDEGECECRSCVCVCLIADVYTLPQSGLSLSKSAQQPSSAVTTTSQR